MGKILSLMIVMIIIFGVTVSTYADFIDRGGGLFYDTGLNLTYYVFVTDEGVTWHLDSANLWAASLTEGGVTGWQVPTFAQMPIITHGFGHIFYGLDEYKSYGNGDSKSYVALAVHTGDVCTPVPEPSTMLLLGSGLIGLAGYGRKKFFKK